MSVMIKDCETMRAGSVYVVMRHAIVEVRCVNVVIGVHIVVLSVPLVVVRVVPIFLAVILQFISLASRSHYSQMFSLYSHGILGVVFTPPVGYSRPPSAVNDPTVIEQVNSENHASIKCPNHFFYQVALFSRCWVRLRGDSRKKNSTMILASFTKTKNSFASIFGCVELHLLCLLTVAR